MGDPQPLRRVASESTVGGYVMMKEVVGFKGYFVSDTGDVFSGKRKEFIKLKPQLNIDGYRVVNLFKDGKYYHCRIARLVAEAFLPNPDNLPVVNHIDHVVTNDSVDNLEWCTVRDNAIASQVLFPERWRGRAEISEEDAHEICRMIEEGRRNKEIHEITGFSVDLIKHIRAGKTWKCVSKNYTMTKSRRAVSEETVRWICRKIVEGLTNREIVRQSTNDNVSTHIVKQLRGKRTWVDISKEYF